MLQCGVFVDGVARAGTENPLLYVASGSQSRAVRPCPLLLDRGVGRCCCSCGMCCPACGFRARAPRCMNTFARARRSDGCPWAALGPQLAHDSVPRRALFLRCQTQSVLAACRSPCSRFPLLRAALACVCRGVCRPTAAAPACYHGRPEALPQPVQGCQELPEAVLWPAALEPGGAAPLLQARLALHARRWR